MRNRCTWPSSQPLRRCGKPSTLVAFRSFIGGELSMFTNVKNSKPILVWLVVFLATATAFGQSFTATLTGTVTDPNGASIPGATVKVQNIATNEVRQTVTGTERRFTVSQLLPGDYDVTA